MAKIIGNITATPSPKPDWAQVDPAKADFIKNKPSLANDEGENSLVQLVPEEPNVATGNNTFVTGKGNKALYDNQTVIGTYNDASNLYLFTVGNGTDDTNRKNAFEVRTSGKVYFHNGVAVNKAETEALIDEKVTAAISGAISASY